MDISVRSDLDEVTRALAREYRSQVPFAAAGALTGTAWDVAKEGLNPEMARAFDYRSAGTQRFFERGWRVEKASKTRLVARLSHRSPILDKQVNPGRYSGRAFAREKLGIYARLDGRPEVAVRMPGVKTRSPATLRKAYRIPIKDGAGGLTGLIIKRRGKAGAQRRRVQRTMDVSSQHAREFVRRSGEVKFGLFEDARVARPLDVEKASRATYEKVWPRRFDESLTRALRTAR